MTGFLISFALSSSLLPVIILIARRFDITDKPDERKRHSGPIPLLGGLGIYIAYTITMLIFVGYTFEVIILLAYSGIMALIGIVDDLKDIKAFWKLAVEIILALTIALLGVRLNISICLGCQGIWADIVDIVISVIWIVGITNAINIMDGLDGLAGGIALIAGAAFTAVFIIKGKGYQSQISLIFIGSILGFLIYNFHPSKIFMGDGGSLFIGSVLSILSIIYINTQNTNVSIWVSIIILALPIFETGSSILRRVLGGRSMMKADNEHFHNGLIERGRSQLVAVSILYSWAILAGAMGVLITIGNLPSLALFIIISLIVLGVRTYI